MKKIIESFGVDYQPEDWLIYLVVLLIVLFLVGLLLLCIYELIYENIDNRRSTDVDSTGDVIDKVYSGASTTNSSYVIPNGNGGVSSVVSSDTEPEKFLLFVKDRDGNVHKMSVDMDVYYKYSLHDKIKFGYRVGGLSKKVLKIWINE